MDDIIGQIYLQHLEEYAPSAEYWAIFQELDQLWTAAAPALGTDVLADLQDWESGLRSQSNYEWFREGWRMGMLLSLELLGRSQ